MTETIGALCACGASARFLCEHRVAMGVCCNVALCDLCACPKGADQFVCQRHFDLVEGVTRPTPEPRKKPASNRPSDAPSWMHMDPDSPFARYP